MVQGGNFVLRRDALKKIGGFNTAIAFYGEDTDIARRMSQVGSVKFTFGLKMYTSARRLKHEGIFTMAGRYGSFVGNTPSTLNLAPGKHDIVVKKAGYKDWTRSMTVASGTIRVSAEMVTAQ
jgi:hypothetical protein